ncbi:hypothetical protein JCM31826_09270 [Thermaurantimonas aggregans]|uniref:Uncharacterized protein n=1 Tax=Thermaurantimonas aggregans TaxID=2173829 RepID=A0A401XK80_9FLAO|nr:hypothetical protein [Thermaurantimonas aggregans]MCX8148365.1 hypothetical protein [Thermaurantimonas aggregans]GCD77445.1 hypothetical protein JCM31826_09270 [Thermaurantimonas aggregans]
MKKFIPYLVLLILGMACSRDEQPILPPRPEQPGIVSLANKIFGLPKTLFFRFEQWSTYKAYIDNKYLTDRLNTEFYAYNFTNQNLGDLIWHDVPMVFRANHYYGNSLRSDSLLGYSRALTHQANSLEWPSFIYSLYAPKPMFFTIEGLTLDYKVDTIQGFTIKWPVDSALPQDNPLLLFAEFDVQGQPATFADTLAEWDGQYDYSPLLLTQNQKKKIKLYLARGTSNLDTIGTRTAGFSFIHFGEIELDIK